MEQLISIVIATYGSARWKVLAERAASSGVGQLGVKEIVQVHGATLAQARNEGARRASAPWLLFLDADDELASGYGAAMVEAIRAEHDQDEVLFTPRTSWRFGARARPAKFPTEVPIEQGNWLVIGTVISTPWFWEVGGFEEWEMYEDWALFARIQKNGGLVVRVPDAVYIAHRQGRGSRNHPREGQPAKLRAHNAIRRAVFPELYEEG